MMVVEGEGVHQDGDNDGGVGVGDCDVGDGDTESHIDNGQAKPNTVDGALRFHPA